MKNDQTKRNKKKKNKKERQKEKKKKEKSSIQAFSSFKIQRNLVYSNSALHPRDPEDKSRTTFPREKAARSIL